MQIAIRENNIIINKLKKSYNGIINTYHNLVGKDITTITELDVIQLERTMQSKYKQSTIQTKLSRLSGLAEKMVLLDIIKDNPVKRVLKLGVVKQVKQDQSKRLDFSLDQIISIIKNLKSQGKMDKYCLFRFLLDTGCRISEATSIQYQDCKIKEGIVEIKVIGKGRKERYVFVDRNFYQEIISTFKQQDKEDTLLFKGSISCKLSTQTANKWVKDTLKAHGVDGSPHSLRHAYATFKLQQGSLSLLEVSRNLGHSSVTTTDKFYIHTKQKMDKSFF